MKNEQNLKRILLIDKSDWLNFAKKILSESGYATRTAPSVKDGWRLLQKKQYELILVDLSEVELGGKNFQQVAKLQTKRNHLIVVMSPTELTPEKADKIFKLGAHYCVGKKYEKPALLELVKSQFAEKPITELPEQNQQMNEFPKILIIEDDNDWRSRLTNYLKEKPYILFQADSYSVAVQLLQEQSFDVIVLDLRLIEDSDNFEGMELLKVLRKKDPISPVIIVSAYGTDEHVRDAFKRYNVHDYISKQRFVPREYQKAIETAIHQYRQKAQAGSPSLLSISCKPRQVLGIQLDGTISRSHSSNTVLDIDPDVFARQAASIPALYWCFISKQLEQLGDDLRALEWRFISKYLGEQLYQKIFNEHIEVSGSYNLALGAVGEKQLHLRFESDRDFLRVPLEFLFAQGDYLVLKHPLTRLIKDVSTQKQPLSSHFFRELGKKKECLKIMLIASNTEPEIPGVDQEINLLKTSIKTWFESYGISVQVRTIPTSKATYDSVKEALRNCKYHILHYAGHGDYDMNSPEKSSIFFWEKPNRHGKVKKMLLSQLHILLQDSDIRFAYLSCCSGTTTGEPVKLLDNDFLGIADGLVQAHIPAVLGFRWPVFDKGAKLLSQEFYKSLAEQGQIDVALLNARRYVAGEDRDDITWLSPILVMQGLPSNI